jgi:hypothetical protein
VFLANACSTPGADVILGLGNWILDNRKLVKGAIWVYLAEVAVAEEKAISKLSSLLHINEGECVPCGFLCYSKWWCHELGGLFSGDRLEQWPRCLQKPEQVGSATLRRRVDQWEQTGLPVSIVGQTRIVRSGLRRGMELFGHRKQQKSRNAVAGLFGGAALK